jgi:hypothetical protein
MIGHQVHSKIFAYLPEYGQSNCGVFQSGDVQVYLWMLRSGNILLLSVRFLDVVKFTTQIPLLLLLLILFKPSLPIMKLKISSLPTLALKSPKQFSYGVYGIYQTHVPIPRISCPHIIYAVQLTPLQLVNKSDALLMRQFPFQQDQTGLHLAINVPLLA